MNKLAHNALFLSLTVILSFTAVFSAHIVIAQETSGDFKGGSFAIGYDNRTCNASLEGHIRYNSGTSAAEYCNGTTWATW